MCRIMMMKHKENKVLCVVANSEPSEYQADTHYVIKTNQPWFHDLPVSSPWKQAMVVVSESGDGDWKTVAERCAGKWQMPVGYVQMTDALRKRGYYIVYEYSNIFNLDPSQKQFLGTYIEYW